MRRRSIPQTQTGAVFLPLGINGSFEALGVEMTSQPGSSSDGPKNDKGRLGFGGG